MRYTIFLLALAASSFGFTQIVVPEVIKPMYGIVEATWCGNCGQYGGPATANIISQTEPNAIYLGLHSSSSSALHSPTATAWVSAFGASGQPIFTVNGNVLGPYSGTIVNTTVTTMNNFYAPTGADANAGFESVILGDTLYVNTKTTFFNGLDGIYHVGIYVYEDSIWEWQVNYDPGIANQDIWHNHILRTSLNGNFGTEIANGSIAAGTSFDKHAKIKLNAAWNPNHLHVFTVVWKKNGGNFDFVNANNIGSVATGTVDLVDNNSVDFSIFPNPATERLIVNGCEKFEEYIIEIFDMSGQLIHESTNQKSIDVSLFNKGVYLVKITSNEFSASKQFVKL